MTNSTIFFTTWYFRNTKTSKNSEIVQLYKKGFCLQDYKLGCWVLTDLGWLYQETVEVLESGGDGQEDVGDSLSQAVGVQRCDLVGGPLWPVTVKQYNYCAPNTVITTSYLPLTSCDCWLLSKNFPGLFHLHIWRKIYNNYFIGAEALANVSYIHDIIG